MTWSSFWGTFWGGVGPSLSGGTYVWAISERQVWVTCAATPMAESALRTGDALNPASWRITKLDNSLDLIVMGSRQIAVNTFELLTLKKFGAQLIDHRVVGTLVDPMAGAFTLDTTFAGCKFVAPAEVPGGMVDIANSYAVEDGAHAAGTLKVASSGDYTNQSGEALWRKLIIRRLTSDPNEFFHMDPESYGVGLHLKEAPTLAAMPAMRARVMSQLMSEPEFRDVRVQMSLRENGVLLILVRVTLAQTGDQVTIPVPTKYT